MNVNRVFRADGRPFFSVGGQARNSSGYNAREAEPAFRAVKAVHGNTLEIPVYWEQVEPHEGRYDFASVDALLDSARRHELKLILLWFGAWKNGNMQYAPSWVKIDSHRFRRVVSPSGVALWVLSSHCEATFEADRRAFTALCRHLRERDGESGTVIALQIENEPGILGSDRDYAPAGEAVFRAPVPPDLMARLEQGDGGPLNHIWEAAGRIERGTWPELFGRSAGELMTAWSIARYIDALAEAGKAALDVPMLLNVWLAEKDWRLAGESYPSGGAVLKTLDLYKWFTPHIDIIAPDIYVSDSRGYGLICAGYARDDNPLFVPESSTQGANAWNMFRAVAEYGAIGYHVFGSENVLDEDGAVTERSRQTVESLRCLSAAAPLILAHQGTDSMHAIVQEEHLPNQILHLDGYSGLALFQSGSGASLPRDWRYASKALLAGREERGRGLVIQAGPHEFFLVGAGYRLLLRRHRDPEYALDASFSREALLTRLARYVSVEEGHLTSDGRFVVDRRRNGDETDHGVWVEPDVGVVRVIMGD